ncbi:hypothetical protein E3E12_00080 [Formicincola oecophyllae]|uniref:Uncharacterized protein n=1 Tax=Formicincola oecophyllae TaxID=2558361 RepID=A0A4Y6U8U0_9PROT|nr:hypothetical protein [Formicincola oecophyllae]QDH12866.1 hypothetical protein E3E12_00080 [Formicincola oecophyllae]
MTANKPLVASAMPSTYWRRCLALTLWLGALGAMEVVPATAREAFNPLTSPKADLPPDVMPAPKPAKVAPKLPPGVTLPDAPKAAPPQPQGPDAPRVFTRITNLPFQVTVTLVHKNGKREDMMARTPLTGYFVGLDASTPIVVSWREAKRAGPGQVAQVASPSRGLVFGPLAGYGAKKVQPFEDTLIATSTGPKLPDMATLDDTLLRGFRVDVTPLYVMRGNHLVASGNAATPYQDGDIVRIDAAAIAYRPYGTGTAVTLPHSGSHHAAPLTVKVPALSYATTALQDDLSLNHPVSLAMTNPVTGARFFITIKVLPQSRLSTIQVYR